jgi:hypothetical protein
VICPCREASDATCRKTLHQIRSTAQLIRCMPLTNQMHLLISRTQILITSSRQLHQNCQFSFNKCTRNPRRAQVSFTLTPRIARSCVFIPFQEFHRSCPLPPARNTILYNDMTANAARDPSTSLPDTPHTGRKLWQTVLLLAGSAAFGGLAVAFWNKKTLAEMRNRTPEPSGRPIAREDDIY